LVQQQFSGNLVQQQFSENLVEQQYLKWQRSVFYYYQ
jgi:hypothetical protein